MKIAGLNIPHTFLMGKIGSNFLAKISAEVYFKVNMLHLHKGG